MRVRLRFVKVGKVRWTSARDVARMWERAFRRVELPLAYTEGFSPRPKVSFGLALPTGAESLAEYLDIDLAAGETVDVESLPARLSPALPVGVDVTAAAGVDTREPSLQHDVTSCTWEIELVGVTDEDATRLVERALAADSLPVTRERKGAETTDDLRPGIRALAVLPPDGRLLEPMAAGAASAVIRAETATQPRGMRPSELVRALGPDVELGRVLRTFQWIERDGARREPIPLPATAAPHATTEPARAS